MSHPKIPAASPDTIVWLALHDKRKKYPAPHCTLEDLFTECCAIFHQDPVMIRRGPKKEEIVLVRRIFAYVACMVTNASLLDISKMIGGHEHTKASYSRDKVIAFLDCKDPYFMEKWDHFVEHSEIWKTFNAK